MRGRPCTQPFLVEAEKGGFRLSPQRNASPAPLGNPVAPSSVTSGDSFPPRGSLWVVQSYTKKRSKSGHVHGSRNSPTTIPLRYPTPKQNERAASGLKIGGAGGIPPRLFASGLSLEKARIPRPGPGGKPRGRCQPAPVPAGPAADDGEPPGRCTPWHRKSSTTRRVRSTLPRPRPGPGGNPPRRS